MKPYKLFHIIYLPLAVIIFIITCYYSLGFAEFEREKNFSKDLRIELPEYIIDDKQVTSIYDGGKDEGLFLYDSLAYSIILKAPLPDKSIKVILSERLGWEHVGGDTYSLGRNFISERMECTYMIGENKLSISYLYDFDSFVLIIYPLVATIALAIIYVVMLIVLSLFLLARTRFLNNRNTGCNV
jgi:hypothetical protein